jgi:hypothetical protein
MFKNNLLFTAIIISILFAFTNVYSQSKEIFNKKDFFNTHKLRPENQKLLELENKIVFNDSRITFMDSSKNEIDIQKPVNPNAKSPYLGALFSGLIPGTGEFYAKSYIKSAVFLGLEAGLWIMYAVFQNKGNNQTDVFQNYANQNWDMRKYARWLHDQGFEKATNINPEEPDLNTLRTQINACEEINFSHTLPPPGDQQYYEVIGKYQNFVTGWSTANPSVINKNNYIDYRLSQVDYYMIERQKANDYFSNGSLTLTGVIINHVLSLADAVWSVHNYNNKLSVQGYVDLKSKYSVIHNGQVLVPHANLIINF